MENTIKLHSVKSMVPELQKWMDLIWVVCRGRLQKQQQVRTNTHRDRDFALLNVNFWH